MTLPHSPRCANAKVSGFTSTVRSARCSHSRRGTNISSAAWSAPTRSHWTCINGCTCRSRRPAPWCATARPTAKLSRLTPEYLEHTERGLASGTLWFSEYGLQLSRGFRALKVWLSIKEHGLDKFGRLIDQNIAQAASLTQLVRAEPDLELMAPTHTNIVCFRFNPGGMTPEALDAMNEELLIRLHESGVAAPSYTTLGGRYCLRAAIVNHRTVESDLVQLIEAVTKIGRELTAARSE